VPIDDKARQELLSRLRRIEGQARGVQRMLDEGRDCAEIVHQLASIRSAAYSASVLLLKHYARECVPGRAAEGQPDQIEDLVDLMLSSAH